MSTEHCVLINEEKQYSLWLSSKPIPAGWTQTGVKGSKEECLEWVEKNWTDMRPLSVQKQQEQMARAK